MDLPPVPLARPGRRVAAALVALLLAWAVYIVFNNPNFQLTATNATANNLNVNNPSSFDKFSSRHQR